MPDATKKRRRDDAAVAADAAPRRADAGGSGGAGGGAGVGVAVPSTSAVTYANKQRVLVFGSRGMTARYRHLMEDVRNLIPHHKKESKLDTSDDLTVICEIAQAKSAETTLFFDVRKKRDLFLWAAKTPAGPSVKFHVVNVHTSDELRLTGNALKGSRPFLSFDRAFDDDEGAPHLRIVRELLSTAFATPRGHPKSQPFHDRVMSFGWADGKVWVRNYAIVDAAADAREAARLLAAGESPTVLVEIGPRFVLDIVRIFAGAFAGTTLYSSPTFVSPHQLRVELNRERAGKYANRMQQKIDLKSRAEEKILPVDAVRDVFKD